MFNKISNKISCVYIMPERCKERAMYLSEYPTHRRPRWLCRLEAPGGRGSALCDHTPSPPGCCNFYSASRMYTYMFSFS